jgi:hypothetical protein
MCSDFAKIARNGENLFGKNIDISVIKEILALEEKEIVSETFATESTVAES